MRTFVVGTRKSLLATTQTNWIIERLKEVKPDLQVEVEKIVTKGDKILDVTLSKVGGKGLFVSEIEDALLKGQIDFAVHSSKDLPSEMPEGLVIGTIPEREDPRDCLITRDGRTLEELPSGAVVGTSSLRRQAQILAQRPDLVVKPIRGNVDTRIHKLKEGQFDAIVLAVAGLKRIHYQEEIAEILPVHVMVPAVGQGTLAVQCRADDQEMIGLLRQIWHEPTALAYRAERAFLKCFSGGCHLPIAAYAEAEGDKVKLTGLIASPNGDRMVKGTLIGQDPEQLGTELAKQLIDQGANEILTAIVV